FPPRRCLTRWAALTAFLTWRQTTSLCADWSHLCAGMRSMANSSPLASWNDGAAKSAILDFVARVTQEGGPDFAPPAERVATFDNDGTLCCEQPLQIQFYFAFGRVKELAAKDPALAERQPFKAVLEHDYNTLFGLGLQALYELAFATHA